MIAQKCPKGPKDGRMQITSQSREEPANYRACDDKVLASEREMNRPDDREHVVPFHVLNKKREKL